jgi:hypothetical protein
VSPSFIFGLFAGIGWSWPVSFAVLHHCLGILSALRLFSSCILVRLHV